MKNRPLLKTWTYKCGNRYWWTVNMWKCGERPVDDRGDGLVDFEWAFEIERDEMKFFASSITGQYDETPDLQGVMNEFAHEMMAVAIGFTKWGEAVKVEL